MPALSDHVQMQTFWRWWLTPLIHKCKLCSFPPVPLSGSTHALAMRRFPDRHQSPCKHIYTWVLPFIVFQNILSQVQTLPHHYHLLVRLPFMTQPKAQKASGWYFLCPVGIFMGFLFGFIFAMLLRIVLLFFRSVVTSTLQGILLRKITQLLPEAYTSRKRAAPTTNTNTTSSQEIMAQRTEYVHSHCWAWVSQTEAGRPHLQDAGTQGELHCLD